MNIRTFVYACNVLGIRETLYGMSESNRQRLRNYFSAHTATPLQDDVYLHNSQPFFEGATGWKHFNKLVFRGSRISYDSLRDGFAAVPDSRFGKPCIIRDDWRDKNVNTHMQTKAVLAWSKSFYVALEYACGCIGGTLGTPTPGYLYFCSIDIGLDVTETIREWEQENPTWLSPPIDPGHQSEVITPTVAKNRILATWTLTQAGGYPNFKLSNKTVHAGNFAAVRPDYDRISKQCDEGGIYDYVTLGNLIDREVLV
jgi:hypothetical protein